MIDVHALRRAAAWLLIGCAVACDGGESGPDLTEAQVVGTIADDTSVRVAFCRDGITPDEHLQAVHGGSATEVFAVTNRGSVLEWSGRRWETIADLGSMYRALYLALWRAPAGDLFAVGETALRRPAGAREWQPAGDYVGALHSIHGGAANDVWAIDTDNRILHFDGARWETRHDPGEHASVLTAIWRAPDGQVWAVSSWPGSIVHFDGVAWRTQPTPSADRLPYIDNSGVWLHAVHGGAPNDIWAVGYEGVILHYNGRAWNVVRAPARNQPSLNAVYRLPNGEVWAVGDSSEMLHWNGVAWRRARRPVSPTNEPAWSLGSVWGASEREVWALGDRGTCVRITPAP